MSCRASDFLLDDRPDASLRYSIDQEVARYWGWFKARLSETRQDGKKTVAKYKPEDLLRDPEDDHLEGDLWLPQSYKNSNTANVSDLLRGEGSSNRVLKPGEAY